MSISGFHFDLNLGSLLSPLLVACVFFLIRQARKAMMEHTDKRYDELVGRLTHHEEVGVESRRVIGDQLEAIRVQTTKTNGSVTELKDADVKLQVAVGQLQGAVFKEKGVPPEGIVPPT